MCSTSSILIKLTVQNVRKLCQFERAKKKRDNSGKLPRVTKVKPRNAFASSNAHTHKNRLSNAIKCKENLIKCLQSTHGTYNFHHCNIS